MYNAKYTDQFETKRVYCFFLSENTEVPKFNIYIKQISVLLFQCRRP